MDLTALNGKAFTLWLTDDADESVVFSGTSRCDGQSLFVERQGEPNFEIRPEWSQRIFAVNEEQAREILLGADFCLRLYVVNLDTSDTSGYEVTGLQWPNSARPSDG